MNNLSLPRVIVAWAADKSMYTAIVSAVRANDIERLRKLSQDRELSQAIWRSYVDRHIGEMISIGEDNGFALVPVDALNELNDIRIQFGSALGEHISASVGVGMELTEAKLALQLAQAKNGNQTILFTEEVPPELHKINERAKQLGKSLKKGENGPAPPPENTHAAGGGFMGVSEPGQEAAPMKPDPEASEHSQGESMAALADTASPPEGTHSARDFEEFFHGAAREQDGKDQDAAKGEQKQSEAKAKVIQVLQTIKQLAPQLEQLQSQAPEVYKTIQALISTVIFTGRELLADKQANSPDQQDQNQNIQKSEDNKEADTKDSVKVIKKGKLPLPENAPKHRNQKLAVGTAKEAGPHGTSEGGKIKVHHEDDNKDTWVSVRAGQVLSADGHAISSRNPGGR